MEIWLHTLGPLDPNAIGFCLWTAAGTVLSINELLANQAAHGQGQPVLSHDRGFKVGRGHRIDVEGRQTRFVRGPPANAEILIAKERHEGAAVFPQGVKKSPQPAILVDVFLCSRPSAEFLPIVAEDDTELLKALQSSQEELGPSSQVFDETVRRLVFRSQIERLGHIDRQLQLADEAQARSLLVEKSEVASELRRAGVSLSFLRSYTRSEEPTTGIIAER